MRGFWEEGLQRSNLQTLVAVEIQSKIFIFLINETRKKKINCLFFKKINIIHSSLFILTAIMIFKGEKKKKKTIIFIFIVKIYHNYIGFFFFKKKRKTLIVFEKQC